MTQREWTGDAVARPAPPERPLAELFSELASQTGNLVRQELFLAKNEMSAKARQAGRDAALIAAGGAAAHAGGFFVLAGIVLALGTIIPLWVAAVLVGVVVVLGGYALCRAGVRALQQIDPIPEQSVAALEENKVWVKKELAR